MRLVAEDWHFSQPSMHGSVLAVDLYLNNGQHSRLEIIPWLDLVSGAPDQFPEIVVTAEGMGEDLHSIGMYQRWLARPPHHRCEWSKVEMNDVLVNQINERLTQSLNGCTPEGAAA